MMLIVIGYNCIIATMLSLLSVSAASTSNIPPTIELLEPDGIDDIADKSYTIVWQDYDPDSDAGITLYYDRNTIPGDEGYPFEGLIVTSINESIDNHPVDPTLDIYVWDTSAIAEGSYFVRANISDGITNSSDYSPGKVTITHNTAPWINITNPNGTEPPADLQFIINWMDYDPDNNAVISLYYDNNTNLSDGLLGQIAAGISEDDDDNLGQYVWDTANIENGSYYIYAIIDDDVNPPYATYSSGKLIVKNHAPSITLIEPDGIGDVADIKYTIKWDDYDYEDDANVSIYYDINTTIDDELGIDGKEGIIATNISEDNEEDLYDWNTSYPYLRGNSYYIYAIIDDGVNPNVTAYSAGTLYIIDLPSNVPPTIEIVEPDGIDDLADKSYMISWADEDPDSNAVITLYYDNNTNRTDGLIPIVEDLSEEDELDYYIWDTTTIDNGSYYICARIDDGVNLPVYNYSSGKVTVTNHAPTIELIEPDGIDDIVEPGETYLITWLDWDLDSHANITLYYDNNTVPNDYIGAGIEAMITTDINESVDVTLAFYPHDSYYVWNLADVPEGIYYIRAEIYDYTNPVVYDYSSGRVTVIKNQVPIINITEPDGVDDAADTYYVIEWFDYDPDNDAKIYLYYGTTPNPDTATQIDVNQDGYKDLDDFIREDIDGTYGYYNWTLVREPTPGNIEDYVPMGNYTIFAKICDFINEPYWNLSVGNLTVKNHAPRIYLTSPADDEVVVWGYEFEIKWKDWNPEEDAKITLYYDDNKTMNDGSNEGILVSPTGSLALNLSEDADGNSGSFIWDISMFAGKYYIYAIIDDGVNPQVYNYSIAYVNIQNHAPWIQIIEPNGIDDNAEVFYTIIWDDKDTDDNATITLYYDIDLVRGNGGGDPYKEGEIALLPQGEDPDGGTYDTYVWNTSWLQGYYWVYAEICDGINLPVYDYSDGPLYIENNIPELSITSLTPQEPEGSWTLIRWGDYDPDDNAIITLYYDVDQDPTNGMVQIVSNLMEDPDGYTNDSYLWNTTALEGYYYVCGKIDDGFNTPIYVYSAVPVLLNDTLPWIELIEPHAEFVGTNEVSTIAWIDADPDSNAQISLYYDPPPFNFDFDGMLIVEGLSENGDGIQYDSYQWETIEYAGEYYIFAVIWDGNSTHEPYRTYSPGYFIINNDAPSIHITSPPSTGIEWNKVVQGYTFNIQWEDEDPDSNAKIFLFYSSDPYELGGTQIDINGDGQSGYYPPYSAIDFNDFVWENDELVGDSYTWDITAIHGAFYIYAIIYDEISSDDYKSGALTISNIPPTLTSVAVTKVLPNDPLDPYYNISWVATDIDDNAIINISYDNTTIPGDFTGYGIEYPIVTWLYEDSYQTYHIDETGEKRYYYIWDSRHLAGPYYIYVTIDDRYHKKYMYHLDTLPGSVDCVLIQIPNDPPSITLDTPPPEGAAAVTTYWINGSAYDPDSKAKIYLYYDEDLDPTNGIFQIDINRDGTLNQADFIYESDGKFTYAWDTSTVAGTYYVYAEVKDGVNTETDYSDGVLNIVNNPPYIKLVTPLPPWEVAAFNFTIRWVDDDPDTNALITLYYIIYEPATGEELSDPILIDTSDQYPYGIYEDDERDYYVWGGLGAEEHALETMAGYFLIYAEITDGVIINGTERKCTSYGPGYLYIIDDAPNIGSILIETDLGGTDANEWLKIIWWVIDPDSNAEIKLYYDTDRDPYNGFIAINTTAVYPNGIWEDESTHTSYVWDTSMLSGTFYIYLTADDGVNRIQDRYSDSAITLINTPPEVILVDPPPEGAWAMYNTYELKWTAIDIDSPDTMVSLWYRHEHAASDKWEEIVTGLTLEDTSYEWIIALIPAGNYTVRVCAFDGNTYQYSDAHILRITHSELPTLKFISPWGNQTSDQFYNIEWEAYDPDNDAVISLYYALDNVSFEGILIVANLTEADGYGNYTWDTSEFTVGTVYYIYAIIWDGINYPISVYAPGAILIVNHAPLLEFVALTSDRTVYDTYLIEWTDWDPEENANITLYYDQDTDPSQGLIEIATGILEDDPTDSYQWVITTVPYGTYHLVGKITDGWSTKYYYSRGRITILHVPHVEFISPVPGARYAGYIEIKWNAYDLDPDDILLFNIAYSRDSGVSWYPIIEAQGLTNCTSFFWKTTEVYIYDGTYYMVKINVTDGTGITPEAEAVINGTFIVDNPPDLFISEEDIVVEKRPMRGEPVKIKAAVHSKPGIANTMHNVKVTFYINSKSIGDYRITHLAEGATETAWVLWTPTKGGIHKISVKVNMEGDALILEEADDKNNEAEITVEVGAKPDVRFGIIAIIFVAAIMIGVVVYIKGIGAAKKKR
jgi:hypothetical protein